MKDKRGFTLLEAIVVIAVLCILVAIASPNFMGHTKNAIATEYKSNIRLVQDACERYYVKYNDWPRFNPLIMENIRVSQALL